MANIEDLSTLNTNDLNTGSFDLLDDGADQEIYKLLDIKPSNFDNLLTQHANETQVRENRI